MGDRNNLTDEWGGRLRQHPDYDREELESAARMIMRKEQKRKVKCCGLTWYISTGYEKRALESLLKCPRCQRKCRMSRKDFTPQGL